MSQFFYYATRAWLPFFTAKRPHMNSIAEFSRLKTGKSSKKQDGGPQKGTAAYMYSDA
ncbi:Hypothetical protein FKW44_025008, partial [Caligus rogercresseyi]